MQEEGVIVIINAVITLDSNHLQLFLRQVLDLLLYLAQAEREGLFVMQSCPCYARTSQSVEKARLRRSFPPEIAPFACSPTARRAANGVRKALQSKASEPTAHVAGLGIRVRGLRPSDTFQGFIDRLTAGLSGFFD